MFVTGLYIYTLVSTVNRGYVTFESTDSVFEVLSANPGYQLVSRHLVGHRSIQEGH